MAGLETISRYRLTLGAAVTQRPSNKALQPTPESTPVPSAAPFLGGAAELGR